jgi:transformation/transcription domain-associated protein
MLTLCVGLIASMPEIRHTEPVPFRFTPNLQKFVSAVGTEGRLTTAILAMARGLLETDNDLEHRLSIFIKEEVIAWHHLHQKSPGGDALRDHTLTNIDTIVKRTKLLACSLEREKVCLMSLPLPRADI